MYHSHRILNILYLLFFLCHCKFIEGKNAPLCCVTGPDFYIILNVPDTINIRDTIDLKAKLIDIQNGDTISSQNFSINWGWSSKVTPVSGVIAQILDSNRLVGIQSGSITIHATLPTTIDFLGSSKSQSVFIQ